MNNYQHRKGTTTIKLLDEKKRPLKNEEVIIAQKDHDFLFGCNGFELVPYANNQLKAEEKADTEKYIDKLLDLFNFVTLPFYWAQFEEERGKPRTEELKNAASWCKNHNLTTKAHPLSWHTLAPDWLLDLNNQEIWQTQLNRVKRELTDFNELIDMWDVINEVVIMPNFDKYDNGMTRIAKAKGRINVVKQLFDLAQDKAPKATFILNDFDVSAAYEILIEGCLEAGIEIDQIGIQSHMHQGYWGLEKTQAVLERFSRFEIPIQFSELSLVSGKLMPAHYQDLNDYQVAEWPTTAQGEKRQAEEVVEFYKTLFAHPLVEGITWWDLIDGQWLNAPSGLIREDYSAKPAYNELKNLIKNKWWTGEQRLISNEKGEIDFEGFAGDYSLIFNNNENKFSLTEDTKIISVQG